MTRCSARALWNTFLFAVIANLLVVVLATALAEILIRDFKGKWLVRFLVLLPWVAPVSLATITWLWTLDSIFSPIDWVLRQLGLITENMYWLGRPGLANDLGDRRADVADRSPGGRDRDGRPHRHPHRDQRRRRRRRRRLLAEACSRSRSPAGADHRGRGALRGDPHDLRHERGLRPHPGRTDHSTQVLSTWAFIKGIEGGSLAQGAAVALFLLPVLIGISALVLRLARRRQVM